jgi:hypothetical protein
MRSLECVWGPAHGGLGLAARARALAHARVSQRGRLVRCVAGPRAPRAAAQDHRARPRGPHAACVQLQPRPLQCHVSAWAGPMGGSKTEMLKGLGTWFLNEHDPTYQASRARDAAASLPAVTWKLGSR